MNFAKQSLASAFKSTIPLSPTFRPSINLSILETLLPKCQTFHEFNQILSQTIFTGFIKDTFASSRLLNFATNFQFLPFNYLLQIFTHVETPNGFIYNTMMRSCLKRSYPENALPLYKLLLENGDDPDKFTYPILAQACAVRQEEFEGGLVHCHVVKLGFDSDVYVNNTLIFMYAANDSISYARKVFDGSGVKDIVSWNSILAVYMQVGDVEEAKMIYKLMPERNVIASNSMIVLFGRAGCPEEASNLFREMPVKDMISWSGLISCYEQNEMYEEALVLFKEMNGNGVLIDEVVVVSALSACAHLLHVRMGKLIHGLALRIGIKTYVNLNNALIHMYSTCGDVLAAQDLFNTEYQLDKISWNSMISGYLRGGSVEKARALFDSMPEKDIVSWSAMISGYSQHDRFPETLALFQEMMLEGIRPDESILVSVISACTHLAALDQAKWVHAYIRKHGIEINVILGTTLVDMYMKCGCIESALEVFYNMEAKGVSTWNALIVGFAVNGLIGRSLEIFSEMKKCGVEPNDITFMGVLGACRHMGLVEEGRRHFYSMIQDHKLEPNIKHYGCMVDLFGRAGRLKEAEELIEEMPMVPDDATWGALLAACKKHGDNVMGERVGRKLVELHPDHGGFHVLLSNIYASKGNWDNVLEVREAMLEQGIMKIPGCSMIEANGVAHEFLAGDRSHPQINLIEEKLDEIAMKIKMEGYAPEMNEVSLDIDEEEKETTLFRHSEKLAIAFGLIATSPSTPIRIMKNLRICTDCHEAAKLVSKAFDREILVRDRHRFHHFKQGGCSCMDYCIVLRFVLAAGSSLFWRKLQVRFQ